MFYTHERNFGCRIREYVYRGLRTVTLENELIRVTILADKGTDIIEFLHKPTDTDFLWRSPTGVRNPANFVPTSASPRGAFLDYYEGGWQEILPAGGDPCVYKGISFGVHGEVSLIPWQYAIEEDCPEKAAVKFWTRTYRTPFYIEKTVSLESHRSVLTLKEKVINEGQEEMDMMWGHHPAFGVPFLDDSCVIDLPPARVLTRQLDVTSRTVNAEGFTWPMVKGKDEQWIDLSRVPPPETRNHDWACLSELEAGWYALTNQARRVGFGLIWPKEVFPYIWFWQCTGGGLGPPFFGRAYTMALEPWTTYPDNLALATEQGTAVKISPGGALEVEIKAVAYSGVERVSMLNPDGQVQA
jgi:galactose mutarotase-like enzyme